MRDIEALGRLRTALLTDYSLDRKAVGVAIGHLDAFQLALSDIAATPKAETPFLVGRDNE